MYIINILAYTLLRNSHIYNIINEEIVCDKYLLTDHKYKLHRFAY